MTIETAKQEIGRFLASPKPEVLCLIGKWGTGKTYCWNKFYTEAQEGNLISLRSSAYVSLFGLSSLEELKLSIFENLTTRDSIGFRPNPDSLRKSTATLVRKVGPKISKLLGKTPAIHDFAGGLQSLAFLAVENAIICIDDLDRKSDHLTSKEVLGLASLLKEQRGCKVVIIVNNDALGEDKEDFSKHSEKVIDISIVFAPSAHECAHTAIEGESQTAAALRSRCIELNITNIRIIKRIERLVLQAENLLKDYNQETLFQAIHTLTLFGWLAFSGQHEFLEFVLTSRANDYQGLFNKQELSEDQKYWSNILDKYKFRVVDELDNEILDSVRRGYFDKGRLSALASAQDAKMEAAKARACIQKAWRVYSDSFEDNESELENALTTAIQNNLAKISPLELDSVLELLRDLGKEKEAQKLVQAFMAERKEEKEFFDTSHYRINRGGLRDPELKAAFEQRHREFKDDREPDEVLLKIAQNEGWSQPDIDLLASMSVEQYREMFLKVKGGNLRPIVAQALQFGRFSNGSEEMITIAQRATDALRLIGRSSKLNAIRVSRFGITLE